MEDAEVKTLSKRQQRLSLGETANRKNVRAKEVSRRVTRTSVLRPNGIEWPEYDDVKKKELMDLLKTLFKGMKVPNRKVPLGVIRKVEVEKRGTARREWMMQEAVKVGFQINTYLSLRSSVALGVNCVSKALETNQLVGIIIEKDVNPEIITKLLIPLAEGKGVPIVSIDGLNSTFKFCCGMRCIAFGLKRACAEITHHFYPVVELMQSQEPLEGGEREMSHEPSAATVSGGGVEPQQPKPSSMVTPTPSSNRKRKNQKKAKFEALKIRKVSW